MIRNIFTVLILSGLIYLSFSLESATSVQKKRKDQFSAEAASVYLNNIAKETHPMGSLENQKVRDYLVQTLRDQGLQVKLDKGYVKSSWKPTYVRMAYVENVVATLKGSDPDAKQVIIAGHYDSVFEGPGAADDGYAVACMIETIKMLKSLPRKNDIVLLITDGEEMGLFGAKHYVENNDISNVGVLLNFEARGNEGPGIAFEYSENNAWLIEEMAKASKRPIANSLSYEIYKRMPNGSDFTVFADEGIQGINYAFIDGFSYYHNPVDNIENLSLESVQHTGENMYRMAKHFANYEFGNPPAGDASFYNFYGSLIHYSASYDLFILIFCLLLLGFTFYRYFKRKEVTVTQLLLATLSMIGVLLLVGLTNYGLAEVVKKMYPQYSTFYSFHYYNHEWYLLAGIGLSLCLTWWFGSKIVTKWGHENAGLSAASLLGALSLVLYVFVPTGTYLMMFPMLALIVGLLATDLFSLKQENWQAWILALGMLSVFVGIWSGLSHNLFLGFSFGALPGAVIPTVLFCFAGFGLIPVLWQKKEFLIPILGACLFSYAMINGHLRSKPTQTEPLKSSLFFVTDHGEGKSYWASRDKYINAGHLNLLDDAEQGRLPRHLPYSRFKKESKLTATRFKSEFTVDTFPESNSMMVNVKNRKRAGIAYLVIDEIENIHRIRVNGKLNKEFEDGATGSFASVLYGIGADSMSIEMDKRDFTKPVDARINFSYQEPFMKEILPVTIVRNNGYTYVSNKVTF
ncbi:MAG: M20/M25/M40 family metallo-hydrolase [Saprospiraceae bacterium]|nr:M20/M25/M40 family metallo-hydrolase [Saprospiraceae bacterium]